MNEYNRHNAKFFNNLKGKIEKQKIGNNLEFIRAITEEWNGNILANNGVRTMLKNTLINYIDVQIF